MSFTSTLYSRKWKNGEESVQTVVWDNSGADLPWVTDLGLSFTLVYQAWPNVGVESFSYCC